MTDHTTSGPGSGGTGTPPTGVGEAPALPNPCHDPARRLAQRLRQLSAAAIELWREADDPTAERLIHDAAKRLWQAALRLDGGRTEDKT